MKKILYITIWVLVAAGFVVMLGFVESKEDKMLCNGLEVNITREEDNFFIEPHDIQQLLQEKGDSVTNQPVSTLNIPGIENMLNSHPAVSTADAYMQINGTLKVDINQRKPIVRIIDKYNNSYYIDDEGKLMPLIEKYTAKVLLVNGNLHEPYNVHYMYTINDIKADSTLCDSTLIDDIYDLAMFINNNDFWRAQVQQVYVNEAGDFELVPRVGDQKIIIGNSEYLEEKFKNLLIFYKEGLNTTGWWNKYSVINLKYKNQIVCTKKS